MARVLLIDDDPDFLQSLHSGLADLGHTVVPCSAGQEALGIFARGNLDVVVCDIGMPNIDGIEFTKQVKSLSNLPVILISGLAEFLESKGRQEVAPDGFIGKPFKASELSEIINTLLGAAKAEPEKVDETQFCKVAIEDFISGKRIKYNIFIKLPGPKFVKIAHQGEDISIDRIRAYKGNDVSFLYLRTQDFMLYSGMGVELARSLGDFKLDHSKKLALLKHAGEILDQRIRLEGVDQRAYNDCMGMVESIMKVLAQDPNAFKILGALNQHSDHLYVHSLGVCQYSILLAHILDWSLPANCMKLGMAALLHDVGQKDIDPQLFLRSRANWTPDETKLYEGHPSRGYNLLSEVMSIPDDVRLIVRQHHEDCAGRGFPDRPKKTAIHPMARLIAVVDEFCHRAIKGPHNEVIPPKQAISDMVSFSHQQFDKQFLDALVTAFAVGGARA